MRSIETGNNRFDGVRNAEQIGTHRLTRLYEILEFYGFEMRILETEKCRTCNVG